jgi:hypothetical protein
MVHCGFEGTATKHAIKNPLKLAAIALKGVRTDGPMAPDIDLSKQRPAEYTFSRHVESKLAEIRERKERASQATAAE